MGEYSRGIPSLSRAYIYIYICVFPTTLTELDRRFKDQAVLS